MNTAITEQNIITEIDVTAAFDDRQIHAINTRVRNDFLDPGNSEIALGVSDAAGFEIDDPVTNSLFSAGQIDFGELIPFRWNIIVNGISPVHENPECHI